MSKRTQRLAIALVLASLALPPAFGQLGGSRAGLDEYSRATPDLPYLERESVESHIAIEGRAELRVRPTDIRVVLAVTGEGETAQECQQVIQETIDRLRAAWSTLSIAPEDIVEDFIAVLPVYEWSIEKRGDVDVGIERKTGFRMQTNIHLAVPNDAQAPAALTAAFAQGVTDIIAFDYWSRELDEAKVKARQQALEAALGKSDALLGALFSERPPPVNLQEKTTVRYPESLYHSFVAAHEQSVQPSWRREVHFIPAHRPRNTYYRGLYSDGDVQSRELAMHPEISVISTVRLYFQSPAAKAAEKD